MNTQNGLPRLAVAAALAAGLAFVAAPALADGLVVGVRFDHDRSGHWDRDHRDWHPRFWGDDDDDWGPPVFFPGYRVVIAPPPVAYAPPPPPPSAAFNNAAGAVSATPASPVYRAGNGEYCREYQATIRVNGVPQRSYGTACLGPDGAWRIVN